MDEQIFTEVACITEHNGDFCSIVLNDEYYQQFGDYKREEILNAFFVMGRDRLIREATQIDPNAKIEISDNNMYNNDILCLIFLIDQRGSFELQTHFGKLADRQISIKDGLIHAAKILLTAQQQLKEEGRL